MTLSRRENKQANEVYGACPRDCPDGCSWLFTLDNGHPLDLRGNPDHPFTKGTLCTKMNSYLSYSAHPGRLLYPMKRIGAKGSGVFERISWDQALQEIADRLHGVIASHGAESIWPYAGTGNVGWIQGIHGAGQRLFHTLGASQHEGTICSISGHVGMGYTMGSAAGMDNEHLVHSKLVILWGTNTLVTNQHLWHFVKKARDKGAEIVVIDPMETKTAKRADLHLAPRPGTDGALALGLMNELVNLDAVDQPYLEGRTLGWEGFFDGEIKDFTLKKTAAICGLDESDIAKLAKKIAENRPTGIRLGMGMQRLAGGGQATRVISCLSAVTGDFQILGGGINYSTGPCYTLNKDALCGTTLRSRSSRSLAMTRLGQGLLELTDPRVMALVIWGANPMASNPDQNRIRHGLMREDLFCVVIDNFQTDTADYADILLPSTMQTEHLEINDSYSHLYLNWNEAVVTPPGECLAHTEIFRRLAKTMGLTEPALYASDEDLARAALDSDHPAMEGITVELLREKGWARLNWPNPYQPFLKHFYTPSRKFEFASSRAEADGHGLYPNYVSPITEQDPGDGSLVLLSPASNLLLNSLFSNSPDHGKAGSPTVLLHPDDAASRDLREKMLVRVWNKRGSFQAQCAISAEVRLGVALSYKGYWPKLYGGSNVNATVEERDSDMGQGAIYHDNRVFVSVA